MVADYTVRQGDTEPIFADALTYSDGTPVNLRGATVSLLLRSLAATTPLTLTGTVMVPDPPENGLIQYHPSTTDTQTPGAYLANWVVVFANGEKMTFPTVGYMLVVIEESLTDTVLTIGTQPEVRDVAALLRARTKVPGGKELGTFTDQTRPTQSEVKGLIDDATDEVMGKVQPPTIAGTAYERRVRGAIRLYAAILIETSYWPEQVKANHSPVTIYQQLYSSRIKALISEGETGKPQGEGAGAGGGDAPADAAYIFPTDTGGLVGWGSRW